jgi:methylenetetrahydrofolate dehydrogenase (NADP+)/methenyltetrahydrofolate cyclohydrolase
VDFDAVKKVAEFITPVPGGSWSITVAMLWENTVSSYIEYGSN